MSKFKFGDIAIRNHVAQTLTVGKEYEVMDVTDSGHLTIKDDIGCVCDHYHQDYFDVKHKTPHPHRELMIAYANDCTLEIEYRAHQEDLWLVAANPSWINSYQYRIKPQEPTQKEIVQSKIKELEKQLTELKQQAEKL